MGAVRLDDDHAEGRTSRHRLTDGALDRMVARRSRTGSSPAPGHGMLAALAMLGLRLVHGQRRGEHARMLGGFN